MKTFKQLILIKTFSLILYIILAFYAKLEKENSFYEVVISCTSIKFHFLRLCQLVLSGLLLQVLAKSSQFDCSNELKGLSTTSANFKQKFLNVIINISEDFIQIADLQHFTLFGILFTGEKKT